jgi:coatomer protein complex subunit epsilon
VPCYAVLQERALETVGTLLADPICNNNPHVLLIAGLIYSQEGNYVEALKACHSGLSLEM